jgi:recombination protein RecA
MGALLLKSQFETLLTSHLDWQARPALETVPSGIPGIDLPRGSLTEIYGPESSGRATLLLSILAEATARQESCVLVDAEDTFDPVSAAAAGVHLPHLLWVRSSHDAEQALKAADLLVHGGGFGVVALDLGSTPPATARRISLTSWFRLRRAVEHTPTVLLSVARYSNAKTCASLQMECVRESVHWSGSMPGSMPGSSRLFLGASVRTTSIFRSKLCSPVFMAQAI